MAELTKEWLKQTIAEYEANRDELPFGLDTNSAIELQVFKLALASLEAEPVAYIFKHPAGKLFWALTDESNKEQADVIPVYAAAPASVVPDEIDVNDVPRAVTYFKTHRDCYADGWNACRAAMLHGAEPVSQTYKLPPLSSNEVNDAAWKLHNMLTEHGPLNGRQFNNLKGCFYEALKVAMRNSPVTPDGWISCSERMPDKLIPVMVMYEDGEMWSAMWNGNRWDDGTEYPDPHSVTHWREMPEAPQQEVK
nr:DUF551 domain-containing protein [Escherichia coli]